MTQHQAKRPYGGSQSSITSFFPSQPQGTSQLDDRHLDTRSPPSLPSSVQSNLLSVGMRVRKSVPEGYKTGSEYSAFQLFSDTASPALPQAQKMDSTTSVEQLRHKIQTRPRANAGAGSRELMPFCGLLDVGGMGAQLPWGAINLNDRITAGDEDDVPFLSSQGSTVSNFSVQTPNANKRRCEWDDSGEDEDIPEESKQYNGTVLGNRVLAVPRRRQSAGGIGPQKKMTSTKTQEGDVVISQSGSEVDFAEADFLVDGIFGREVQMGGV